MTEYTPTTEEVRRIYCLHTTQRERDGWGARFDRWLFDHDAELLANEGEDQ